MFLKVNRLTKNPEALSLAWGRVETQIGVVWMVFSGNMLCFLGIASDLSEDLWPQIERQLPRAHLTLDAGEVKKCWRAIEQAWMQGDTFPYPLGVFGSDLEHSVWDTLLQIPVGKTVSYSWVAEQVGRPQAVRAVASAIGRNRVSLLIPCHRVIGKNGGLGGYAWGVSCKQKILAAENASIHA